MFKLVVQQNSGNYWKRWSSYIENLGHECMLLDMRTKAGYSKAIDADGAMWHINMLPSMQASAHSILTALETLGEKVIFPNQFTRWHFDNKVSQSYLNKALGVNTPETNVFWDEEKAIEYLRALRHYPIIAKLKRGAGSSGVYILRNESQALSYTYQAFSSKGIRKTVGSISHSREYQLRKLWHSFQLQMPRNFQKLNLIKNKSLKDQWPAERGYVYFQEFLQDNNYDTRVTVIGNRAFAFQRENRQDDFRASGSGKIKYEATEISRRMIEIAHEISIRCHFQSMAYDFLLDSEGNPSLIEMSFGFQAEAVYNCQGFWNRDMKWFEGHVWPEEAQVHDIVNQLRGRMNNDCNK